MLTNRFPTFKVSIIKKRKNKDKEDSTEFMRRILPAKDIKTLYFQRVNLENLSKTDFQVASNLGFSQIGTPK